MITQKWIEKYIFSLSIAEIKISLNKQRIRFDRKQIVFYLMKIVQHQQQKCSFKKLYQTSVKNKEINISYQAYMKNIEGVCPLCKVLFKKMNITHEIKASSLYNIVDTSLILTKQSKSIQQKDFNENNVTVRTENGIKTYICGYKSLVFLNRKKQIIHSEILNINTSDQNTFKQPLIYYGKKLLKGFLLMDRGFNNKSVRNRFEILRKDQNFQFQCKIISPYHYKEEQKGLTLDHKQRKMYKNRWQIETVFQKLKNQYNQFKLDLTGVRKFNLQEAKYFISIILYNLSTI